MSSSTAFILGVWNSSSRNSAITRSDAFMDSRSASKSDMTSGLPLASARTATVISEPSIMAVSLRGEPSMSICGRGSKYDVE